MTDELLPRFFFSGGIIFYSSTPKSFASGGHDEGWLSSLRKGRGRLLWQINFCHVSMPYSSNTLHSRRSLWTIQVALRRERNAPETYEVGRRGPGGKRGREPLDPGTKHFDTVWGEGTPFPFQRNLKTRF